MTQLWRGEEIVRSDCELQIAPLVLISLKMMLLPVI